MSRCRVSVKFAQYSYMNFISGKRIAPPLPRNSGAIASAEASAMLPRRPRTPVRSKMRWAGRPSALSRISERVPTTLPANFAQIVVVVGSAW